MRETSDEKVRRKVQKLVKLPMDKGRLGLDLKQLREYGDLPPGYNVPELDGNSPSSRHFALRPKINNVHMRGGSSYNTARRNSVNRRLT